MRPATTVIASGVANPRSPIEDRPLIEEFLEGRASPPAISRNRKRDVCGGENGGRGRPPSQRTCRGKRRRSGFQPLNGGFDA